MSAALGIHGVTENEDLNVNWVRYDTRPFLIKYSARLGSSAPLVMFAFAGLAAFLPAWSDFILAGGLMCWFLLLNKAPRFPFSTPQYRNMWGRVKGDGIITLGYEIGSGAIISQDDDTARQHYLTMGTTGSGKTRFLVSMVYCSLLYNSGAIIVDGKGDSLTFWLIYRIARRLDRTDDLSVINFLNGGLESGNRPSPVTRLSNTNNTWASATSDMITEMLAGMMPGGGGDAEYWRNRARTMVSSLVRVLADLRNRGEIALDVETFRSYMSLSKIVALAKRDDFDPHRKAGLVAYLIDLGVQEEDIANFGTEAQADFAPKVIEQHGYLQQQLTQILGELGDTYRHIFGVRYGEVHWPSVLFQRKIVFVLLPVLEKSPDTVAGLGRLIFSGLRTALAPALGDKLEGNLDYVMSRKIAGADVPMHIFFDEWGNYATTGAAQVVTQIRGLGGSVHFLSQDEPGMRKDDKLDREAYSIMGSTNTKICMRIEEMEHTYKLFNLRSGKAQTSRREGSKYDPGVFTGSYHDSGSTRFEEVDRISGRDLVDQGVGQAHILNQDKLIRAQLLYIDPQPVDYARINQWLDCLPSNAESFDRFRKVADSASNFLDDSRFAVMKKNLDSKRPTAISPLLSRMVTGFNKGMVVTEGNHLQSSIIAIGAVELHTAYEDDVVSRALRESAANIVGSNGASALEEAAHSEGPGGHMPERMGHATPTKEDTTRAPRSDEDTGDTSDDTDSASFATHTERLKSLFMSGLESAVSSTIKQLSHTTPQERQSLGVSAQLRKGAAILDSEDVELDIQRGLNAIREGTPVHPQPPIPEQKTVEELQASVNRLTAKLRSLNSGPPEGDNPGTRR